MLLIWECFAQLLLMVLSMLTALGWETGVRCAGGVHVSESCILCTAQGLHILRGDGWGKK